MKLTGKCKKDFDKWYLRDIDLNDEYRRGYLLRSFYGKQIAMQFGVYVDFFDSVEIYIECGGIDFITLHYWFNIQERKTINGVTDIEYKTRPEARIKAIEKANKIYNENHT